MVKFEIDNEVDLKIRYDHTAEIITRQWLKRVLPEFEKFKRQFDSKHDLHGLSLDESIVAKACSDFTLFETDLRATISRKNSDVPWNLKEFVAYRSEEFFLGVKHLWSALIHASQYDAKDERELLSKFKSRLGLCELVEIYKIGIDTYIDKHRDEFYIKFSSKQDYDFVKEVEELADHYNRVTANLNPVQRLTAHRILFTVDTDGVVSVNTEQLRSYKSWTSK